jgi:hypothetical protein
MRIDTDVEKYGKYGRIAWAQRSASKGKDEVTGTGNSPPVQSHIIGAINSLRFWNARIDVERNCHNLQCDFTVLSVTEPNRSALPRVGSSIKQTHPVENDTKSLILISPSSMVRMDDMYDTLGSRQEQLDIITPTATR